MGCGWGWCRGCSASTRWYRARRSCPWAWGEALGCGGSYSAPPVAGWTWLKPTLSFTQLDTVIEEIPVATDGFFAISAQGNSRDLRQVRVVVRDENGEDVPGDVSVLRSVSGSFDDHTGLGRARAARGRHAVDGDARDRASHTRRPECRRRFSSEGHGRGDGAVLTRAWCHMNDSTLPEGASAGGESPRTPPTVTLPRRSVRWSVARWVVPLPGRRWWRHSRGWRWSGCCAGARSAEPHPASGERCHGPLLTRARAPACQAQISALQLRIASSNCRGEPARARVRCHRGGPCRAAPGQKLPARAASCVASCSNHDIPQMCPRVCEKTRGGALGTLAP